MGIRSSGWFEGTVPAAEWFADGYKRCAFSRRLPAGARATLYGYRPTRRQHARVCRLIRAAAKPRGRPPQRPSNPPPVIEVAPPPPQPNRPGEGPACSPVDELLTGCDPTPAPAPAPAPGPAPPPGPLPALP
jgi:hypothetical protein